MFSYFKRIFLIAALLVPVAMHCASKKDKSAQKPTNRMLEFYRNHKVLCGTSLGAASGLFQAWLHSKYTPHHGDYAKSAFAGGIAGAISGATDVIPEVFVAGNVGGALGVKDVNPQFTHVMGSINGVLVGGVAGFAHNNKEYAAGVVGAGSGVVGAGLGSAIVAMRGNVIRNPYIVVPTAAIGAGMAVTAARVADIIGEPEEKIPNDSEGSEAYKSAVEFAIVRQGDPMRATPKTEKPLWYYNF